MDDQATNAHLTLLACQVSVPEMTTVAERDCHLADMAGKVNAKAVDVDLVVLPELSSIDYGCHTFDALDVLAEPLDGPSFQCWRQVARDNNCHIAYSFPRVVDSKYFITLAVVSPAGELIGYYDKLHLAQYGASMEKDYFERGDHLFTFQVKGIRIAPIICYDIRVPELTRTLAVDHGVQLMLHCGAYFRDESFETWHSFAVTRALENQIFLLSLNRAGEKYGNSLFCLPWMDENTRPGQFAPHAEDIKRLRVSTQDICKTRKNYTFLTDKLESYVLPVNDD